MMDKLANASLADIEQDPQLLDFARAEGRAAFGDNCAPCHGAGGGGARAIPTSTTTTGCGAASSPTSSRPSRYGARAGNDKGRQGNMPSFGRDGS